MLFNRLALIILCASSLFADEQAYWVFFDAEQSQTPAIITNRAKARLALRGSHSRDGDLAVSQDHLNQLRQAGFKIRRVSRFLNAVSIDVDDVASLPQLEDLSFVRSITPVKLRRVDMKDHSNGSDVLARSSDQDYGASFTQNQMLGIPVLHNYGYDATGVLIGVFDTGFSTEHSVFNNMDITNQYDFIDHETDASGPGHSHGINVLSVLGGYAPGELIGPAYGASFLLARTEDTRSESRSEEDNWVAAMEWADSLGVDIISTSLNYFKEFDNPAEDYPASALDGQTTIIARAANIAAERGILVVNSAGNEGPSVSSIWPPSDSPHVLSVGATGSSGDINSFSGRGPTYDGRIKPDVVTLGSSVVMASGLGGFTTNSGTSYSAPQIAGLAALLLQAHPSLAPDSIISLFHDYGNQNNSPDNTLGYGRPDLTSLFKDITSSTTKTALVYPNPSQALDLTMVLGDPVTANVQSCTLINLQGRQIAELSTSAISANTLEVKLINLPALANQLFIIRVMANDQMYIGKFVYLRP